MAARSSPRALAAAGSPPVCPGSRAGEFAEALITLAITVPAGAIVVIGLIGLAVAAVIVFIAVTVIVIAAAGTGVVPGCMPSA